MKSELLTELFDTYQKNENGIINLPIDLFAIRELFLSDIKNAIFDSLQEGNPENAKRFLAFAQAIADQTGEPEHHALVAWCHTTLYFNRNIPEAVKYLDQTRRFYAETGQKTLEGRILVGYASQLSQIGRLEEAEQAILRARECLWDAEDYRDWPILYLNLACVQFYQARYEQMLASAQQSESIAQEFVRLYTERADYYKYWMAQAIINQALAALFLGQMEDAERRLDQALALAVSHEWTETMGRARLNLARIYTFQGKFFVALETLQQAEKNFKTVQIDIELATVLLYQADIYKRLMMPLQARSAAVQAAKILFQSKVVAEGIEAYLLATQVSLDRREVKRARRYLEISGRLMPQASPFLQAIQQSYAAHKILNPDKSSAESALKQAEQAYKQLHSLGAVAQMLNASLVAADLAIHLELPDVIQRYEEIIEQCQAHNLTDLEQLACVQLGTYYADSESYVQAQFHLRRAVEILAFKREQMPVEELKATLIGGSTDIYTQLIEVALFNEDTTSALETLIEAKGGIWLDLLSPAEIVPMPVEWTQARAELVYWQEEARTSREVAHIKLCEDRITHAQKILVEMSRTQQRKRVAQTLPTYVDIQARLGPKQIILDYLVGSQQIWACLISQKEVQWLNLGPKQDVERNMSRLNMLFKNLLYIPDNPDPIFKNQLNTIVEARQQTAKGQLTNIQQIFSQLYGLLIEPLQLEKNFDNFISELLVVPDSYLFELPWTAFYDGTLYLGQKYDLTLYPCSALLAFDDIFQKNSSQYAGHPYILGHQGNPPLLHLDNSLDVIQKIWPAAHMVNPAKIVDLKWEQVPLWLHIGAHGHVNRRTPLFSQLDLADGPLLLADIFNLDLHGCELVTLSACETGTTPEQGGVLLALAGSFLCAGAKNVIASLWPVDDEATTILMGSFYKAYGTGMSPQQALQSAQQELRQVGYEHPFYWAAFQVFARAK